MKSKQTQGPQGPRKSLLAGVSVFAGAMAAMSVATPALAQDADDETIVVTGSRIVRSDATSSSPLTVVDAEDIADAGIVGLGEILRRDPAIGSGGFGQSNILSGGGAQTIDLRNLGPQRTLVLINGQRYSLFTDSLQNEGQDLGLLPAVMIERVEVLRDGASTAYGADAVAGVVNFILRDDYEGLHVTGLVGQSGEGDGNSQRLSFLAGASSDRGSATLAMEWVNRDSVPQQNRDWAANPLGAGANASPFTNIGSGIGGPQLRRPNGTLVECFGTFGSGSLGAGPCARYNYAADQDIVTGFEGYNIAFSGRYEVTDNIEWHGAAVYGSRYSSLGLAANPISANSPTGPYLSGIRIGAAETSNPYGETLSLTWRPVEYGAREQSFDAAQIWISTGFSGTIAENYHWDATFTRSEVDSNGQTAVVPNVVRLSRLLNPSQCLADPVCNSPAIGAVSNIVDLFDGTTPLTAGQQNYAFYVQSTNSRFVTEAAVASISGPIVELPAGALSFAAGIEYRSEYGKATPDSVTQSGESVANATFPTEGSFDTFEMFAELDIPILADVAFFDELTANLQYRRSDFSNFGGAETYKAGLVWAPIESLRFRSSYGTSFRAPNVTDLYSIGVQSFNSLADPCSTGAAGSNVSSGVYNDAAAAANCAALNVPLTYVQPAAQLRVLSGGNPNLEPEEGETFTIGAVIQPTFFDPLTITVDYWDIKLDNAIVGGALQTRLNNCYRSAPVAAFSDPNSTCFGLGDRTGSGVPTNLITILQNSTGTSETSGVDFSILLSFDEVGPGALDLSLRGSYLLNADGGLFCGAGFDCTAYLDGNTSGGNGYPEYRLVFDAEYDLGVVALEWTTRYMSEMTDPHCETPRTAFCAANNPLNYSGVPDYWISDARAKFNLDTYNVTVGVNNIADEDPPYAINTGSNTYPGLYDTMGRYFFVGFSADF